MTVLASVHEDHGATFREYGGRQVVSDYGRPARTHRAVRNGVGVVERGYGVVVVTGDDRVEFVDNAISNRVPAAEGDGCYALLLDPQGRVETEMYVYHAGDRLLLLTPPSRADPLVADWREKTFIQDVGFQVATEEFVVFGVHGPRATEKVASVLHGASAPEGALTFVRGELGGAGATIVADDGLAGEEGYEVVAAAEEAEAVFDTLVNRGNAATPFGYRTWETLTLEAGTPLFETEIEGAIPNELGLRTALDFEKGCYVGQEVVSRIENRGHPGKRLVGLRPGAVPERGAAVHAGDRHVGEVTRAAESPVLEGPAALALVEYDLPDRDLSVRVDGQDVPATVAELPFVEGSARSARLPAYE